MSSTRRTGVHGVKELVGTLADGRQRVVAIIGAGVSYAMTRDPASLWRGLLSNGIEYCAVMGCGKEWRDGLEAALNRAGDVEQILNVADSIVGALGGEGGEHFKSWLASSVGRLRLSPEGNRLTDILRELAHRGMILATTNYDSILSHHLKLPPVLWNDYRVELPVMNQEGEGVLHLHGHWNVPSSVIFSSSSYDRIVQDATFQALFSHLWLGYHWVYIGCGSGIDDPNFGRLLKWGAAKFGSASLPHFRLCLNDETQSLRADIQTQQNLRLIGYGKKHDALPRFLEDLSEALPCRPFIRIKEQAQFFRTRTQRPEDVVLPSRREYLDGGVYQPTFVEPLERRLTETGFAWLRGPASHGKTTAALLIATSKARKDYPAYYLDFNDPPVAPSGTTVENVMQSLCRPRVLFILDNVNRNESVARSLYEAWATNRHGSNLLLLGRTDAQGGVFFQHDRHLADLEAQAVYAEVGQEDLGGLFRTLLLRLSPGRTPPIPPRELLMAWHEMFSSDLIVFCWGVTADRRRLRLGNWDVPAEDARRLVKQARRFIWTKYLGPLSEAERRNILLLAAFARHELGLPPDIFQREPFPTSLRMGIVVRTYNDGANDRFHFLDAGLSGLVLGAIEETTFNEVEEVRLVCKRSPSVAAAYSARLEASGEREPARGIARLLLNDHGAKWLLADHLPWAVDTIRRMRRLDAANLQEIDDWLSKEPHHLTQAFHGQPFGALGDLVRYAADKLPRVFERITAIVSDSSVQESIAQRLAKIPPYDLIQFVESLKSEDLKTPLQKLWAKVATPENAPLFVSRALQGSLSQLNFFLEKVSAHRRKHFLSLLWQELERPESVKEIIRNGLHDSLHHFASLASKAEEPLAASLWNGFGKRQHWCQILTQLVSDSPQNSATFLDALKASPQSELLQWLWRMLGYRRVREPFLRNALQGALQTLTNFLDYADREGHRGFVRASWLLLETPEFRTLLADRALSGLLSEFGRFIERATAPAHSRNEQMRRLLDDILDGERRELFDKKLAGSSAGQMIGFFRRVDRDFARRAFSNFDTKSWLALRERQNAFPPYSLAALFRLFHEIGREDLRVGEATAIVKLANLANWDHPTIGLELLEPIIRYAEVATDDEIEHFLDSVNSTWLDYRLMKDSAEVVANFLCSIAWRSERTHIAVDRPNLRMLLASSVVKLSSRGPERGLKALALIGAAALVGLQATDTPLDGEERQRIAQAIAVELNDDHARGALKVQVWLGMWVLHDGEPLRRFLENFKEALLEFWSREEPGRPASIPVRSLSDRMVEWLRSMEEPSHLLQIPRL